MKCDTHTCPLELLQSGVALGSWKVLGVFALYWRVPGGSSQSYLWGLWSPAWSLGRLGVLGAAKAEHVSISGSQCGMSCPELTSLIRSAPPLAQGFWGSHGGGREGKHTLTVLNCVSHTGLESLVSEVWESKRGAVSRWLLLAPLGLQSSSAISQLIGQVT